MLGSYRENRTQQSDTDFGRRRQRRQTGRDALAERRRLRGRLRKRTFAAARNGGHGIARFHDGLRPRRLCR